MQVAITGFLSAMSLIVGIGLQNAFVIKTGLTKHYILEVVILCILSDVILETLGVFGFGRIIAQHAGLLLTSRWLGFIFMVYYAFVHFKSAIYGNDQLNDDENHNGLSRKATMLLILGFTWLNPTVYLDTIVLLGSISNQYRAPFLFLLGSLTASIICFFCACLWRKPTCTDI